MTAASTTMAAGSDKTADVVRSRRRGEALEDAIRAACAAELTEFGFGNVTVESVAARAQTGKASIYRRWPTKEALVADCMAWMLSGTVTAAMTPTVGDDVTTRDALVNLVSAGVALLLGPHGNAFRSLMTESLRDPGFAASVECDFFDPRKQELMGLIRRGIGRGEVKDGPGLPFVPEIIIGTLLHTVVLRRVELSQAQVELFVDGALMPIVEGR